MNDINLKEYAGMILKKLRVKRNMAQEEVAQQLTLLKLERENLLLKNGKIKKIDEKPITRQTVSKYELGKIGMNQDVLFDLCKIFNTSINDFFPPINNQTTEQREKYYKEVLIRKGLMDENGNIDNESFEKLMDFAAANKNFITNKRD